ncbi:MAG: glycogen synthase GlgA [Candidatus Omnitrophica bacterium]|nr:glycogen synthase GlgA [Candidatus Omnitrophota bacterium]
MMKTKILFAAAESAPFFKTGGLADVIGSLPEFLAESASPETGLDVEVKVILPFYRRLANFEKDCSVALEATLNFAGKDRTFRILSLRKQKVEYLFCDQPELFDRDAIYGPAGKDYPDNILRFGFFSYAVLRSMIGLNFQPDIVHCHDWHTGLLPVYLKEIFATDPFYRKMKSIMTIHNLGYQGLFPKDDWPALSLPDRLFNPEGLEFYGQINLLKAGLLWADRITTVSPTYSEEIKTEEFGQKLEGVLSKRAKDLIGILNGIDYQYWNPETDPLLKKNYGKDRLSGKSENKAELFRQFFLKPSDNPLLGVVSRLVPPKGFDLIMKTLPQILKQGFNLVILGSGLPEYEKFFESAAKKHQGVFGFRPGYNEELAHRIYGGADFFLMPSLFEPCGLGQMIALRYGAIPVVRETGGLADSVFNFDGAIGNGFSFVPAKAANLLDTLQKAGAVYRNKKVWARLVSNAFASDFSWSNSAQKYLALYRSVIKT